MYVERRKNVFDTTYGFLEDLWENLKVAEQKEGKPLIKGIRVTNTPNKEKDTESPNKSPTQSCTPTPGKYRVRK